MPQFKTSAVPKNIVLIAFDGVEVLEIAGPASVFSKANSKWENSYKVTVLADKCGEIHTNSGISLNSHDTWQTYDPEHIDTLIIAGGNPETVKNELRRDDLSAWIKSAAKTTRRVASICTGAIALGHANLLDGKRCTTHWEFLEDFQNFFPQAEVVHDQIFVRDKNIWSSGGITTGIDLALAFVEEDLGSQCAVDIASTLILQGIRLGATPQISALLPKQAQPTHKLKDLLPWIQQNIASKLSADVLASRVGMSVRNLNRTFLQNFGVTPRLYVLQIRLDQAAVLLKETNWSIEDISIRSGFISKDSLERGFKKRWSMSPGLYRERNKSP